MEHLAIRESKTKRWVRRNLLYLSLLIIIGILVTIFTLANTRFLSFNNVMNITRQTCVISIVAIGMTFIIIVQGIDLSVGSNIAFGGAIGVVVMNLTGNPYVGMIATILSCSAIGLLNGVVIGRININPLIMTLGTMCIARGLALGILNAVSINVTDNPFDWLGQSQLGAIPVVGIFLVASYIIFHLILSRTSYGLKVYAVGGNRLTARALGINANLVTMSAYILTGALVGIGSIITVGRLASAQPWAGLGLEFDVITAVIIGGTSLRGGEGNILGTLLGAIIIGVLTNGLAFTDLSPFLLHVFRGFMIVAIVFIDNIMHRER